MKTLDICQIKIRLFHLFATSKPSVHSKTELQSCTEGLLELFYLLQLTCCELVGAVIAVGNSLDIKIDFLTLFLVLTPLTSEFMRVIESPAFFRV